MEFWEVHMVQNFQNFHFGYFQVRLDHHLVTLSYRVNWGYVADRTAVTVNYPSLVPREIEIFLNSLSGKRHEGHFRFKCLEIIKPHRNFWSKIHIFSIYKTCLISFWIILAASSIHCLILNPNLPPFQIWFRTARL